MRTIGVALVLAALGLAGCQESPAAPIIPSYELALGPGMEVELPHQNPGTVVSLSVLVTRHGRPAQDVKVYWEDWKVWETGLSARQTLTDTNGIATVNWLLPALTATQFTARASVQAAVPGAKGNPLTYTIEIIRCTRCQAP